MYNVLVLFNLQHIQLIINIEGYIGIFIFIVERPHSGFIQI